METDLEVLARAPRRMMGHFLRRAPGIPFGHTRFEMFAKASVQDFMDPAWVGSPLQAHRAPSRLPSQPDHNSIHHSGRPVPFGVLKAGTGSASFYQNRALRAH